VNQQHIASVSDNTENQTRTKHLPDRYHQQPCIEYHYTKEREKDEQTVSSHLVSSNDVVGFCFLWTKKHYTISFANGKPCSDSYNYSKLF
jgi:hypothetical protein